jgi:hypothetical protein
MSNIIKTIIPDYVETYTTINLFGHTDPGNDIDDETSCGNLLRDIFNRIPKCNMHIVFSVKTKNVARLLEYGIKPYTGIDLNPTFNFENVIPVGSSGNTVTIVFHDGTTFVPVDYYPHYILSISPGLDSVIKESNLVNLRGFSHQGLPGTWNGFNDNGSQGIISHMIDKHVPYFVTTPFESFETLFGNDTFMKYNIPECLHDRIAREAMTMICGRMSPRLPPNVLNFAEGLVNMPLAETLGKPGTNCRLALAIRAKFTGPFVEISDEFNRWIHQACVVYVDTIIESAKSQGATVCPIKQYHETIQSLYEMSVALAEMGMPIFDESGVRLLYSTDGNIPEMFPDAFEKFKEIGIYTPAYDLLAGLKFISLLDTDMIF